MNEEKEDSNVIDVVEEEPKTEENPVETDESTDLGKSELPNVDTPGNEEIYKVEIVEQPIHEQLHATVFEKMDYHITLKHEITLGDFLLSTLLGILIIVTLLSRLIGGGSRW